MANESTKSITAVASGGYGELRFSVSSHGYSAGDLVEITGTTSYNGIYLIVSVNANDFDTLDNTVGGEENAFGSTETGSVARGFKDLGDLGGLTGVSTETIGHVVRYIVDSSTQLDIDGAVLIDPRDNFLEMLRDGVTLTINSTGTLFLGKVMQRNYKAQNTNGLALRMIGRSTNPWTNNIANYGSIEWYGAVVDSAGAIITYSGNCKIRNGFFIGRKSQSVVMQGPPVTWSGGTCDVIGLTKTHGDDLTFDNSAISFTTLITVTNLSGIVSTGQCVADHQQVAQAPQPYAIFSDLEMINSFPAQPFTCLIHVKDSTNLYVANATLRRRNAYGDVTEHGQIEAYKTCNHLFTSSGTGVQDVKVYWVDIDNGGRGVTASTAWGITYTGDRVYTGTSNSNGEVTLNILEAAWYNTNASAGQTVSNVSADKRLEANEKITVKCFSYLYSPTTVQFTGNTVGESTIESPLLSDLLITQPTKATVDAYSAIDDAFEAYDRAKSYLYDNFLGETSIILSRSGNVIELDDANLVLDATASPAFTYTAGSPDSFTFHTDTFTGGATTTGNITVQNGTILSGGTFSGDVTTADNGTTHTGVTLSKFIHTTASTASVTFDASTVTEIEVNGGGTLTVNLINGTNVPTTTQTSGTIILVQNVTVSSSNLIDNTRVQLYNVTDAAEIDNSVVSGGSGYSYTLNLQGSDGDIGDTLRLRATYQSGTSAKESLEAIGILTSTGLSFIDSQADDSIYNGFALDGSTITKFDADYTDDEIDLIVGSNFSADEAYAWWVYNLTTSQGIQEFFGGITAEDSANFRINTSVLNLYWDNDTTSNVYQTDNRRVYRDDLAYPVKDPTTGGGGIDVVWRSQVLLANDLSTTDIRDAVWNATASSYTTAGTMGWETILAGRIIVDTTTTGTPTTTTLQLSSGSSTDDFYNNEIVYIASGTIAGQARIISDYDGATKTITVTAPFVSAPASGVRVVVQTTHSYTSSELLTFAENGVWDASAGSHTALGSMGWEAILAGRIIDDTTITGTPTSTSFQLTAGSTVDDFYNDQLFYIASGSAAGLSRVVLDYDGATKTVTVDEAMPVVPSSGDRIVMQADHVHPKTQIAASVDTTLTPRFTSIETNLTTVNTGIQNNLTVINEGVKDASKLIPHDTDLS